VYAERLLGRRVDNQTSLLSAHVSLEVAQALFSPTSLVTATNETKRTSKHNAPKPRRTRVNGRKTVLSPQMADWIQRYAAALEARDAREQAHKPYIDACT
jgi:hypothetical protein